MGNYKDARYSLYGLLHTDIKGFDSQANLMLDMLSACNYAPNENRLKLNWVIVGAQINIQSVQGYSIVQMQQE